MRRRAHTFRSAYALALITAALLVVTAFSAAAQEGASAGNTKPQPSGTQTESESDLPIPEGGGTATDASAAPAAATPGVSTWDFVRMLLILAAVVGLIYLLFFLLRRGAGRKIQENNLIKVLGSRSLGGNRALHLVDVCGSVFLVGSSEGGVRLISQITEKEPLDTLRLKAAEGGPTITRSFQDMLSGLFRRGKKPFSMDESVELLKGQQERLKKLRGEP